jgi:hypothetical protein
VVYSIIGFVIVNFGGLGGVGGGGGVWSVMNMGILEKEVGGNRKRKSIGRGFPRRSSFANILQQA